MEIEGNELFSPLGIYCQDDYLFLSDSENHSIQILNLDLKYRDTIELNFRPQSSTTIRMHGKKNIQTLMVELV